MRIRGFNFVGEFDTKSTADKDLVHTIYCMDNYALAAIIQDRRKSKGNRFYIIYGYNPRIGNYMAKWGPYEDYYSCRDALEEMFKEQNPDILVNNHRADYISCIYGSYWSTEEYCESAYNHTITRNHLFNYDGRYYYHIDGNAWLDDVLVNPDISEITRKFTEKMFEFTIALKTAPGEKYDRISGKPEPKRRQ